MASINFQNGTIIPASWLNDVNEAVYDTIPSLEVTEFNVKTFGAKGDGVTNDTTAFELASTAINAAGGGKLIIPPGTYIVGAQTFAGAFGKGYAYKNQPILTIENCAKSVIVEGNGAIIKVAYGLRFGSFNPVTGQPYYPPSLPFLDPDYTAQIGLILAFTNCANVEVKDLEIDGNINNQIIGGQWNDTGIQLAAVGVYSAQNRNFTVRNVYTHHNGLDGVEIVWTGLTSSTEQNYPHLLENVVSQYNGRQGLSWVGGNNLTCINCDFSFTGRNGVVQSAPSAGVDIEAESSICINGTFVNTRFYDNAGAGCVVPNLSSWDCSFYNCTFIGTTFWSVYGTGDRYTFFGCDFIGAVVNVLGADDPTIASKFVGCNFSMTASRSPNGQIYGSYHTFYGGGSIRFENCSFDADANHQLPWSAGGNPIYSGCNFKGLNTSGASETRGIFVKYNFFEYLNTNDFYNSVFYGPVSVNGVLQTNAGNIPVYEVTFASNDGSATVKFPRHVYHYDPAVWTAQVGTAIRGDIVFNPSPSASGYIGWTCVTGGNSSTAVWKTFGAISS